MTNIALKDLGQQLKISKTSLDNIKSPGTITQTVSGTPSLQISVINRDSEAACRIVTHLFEYIDLCLKEDKSKVKLNMLTKAFVQGILRNSIRDGINDFLRNMNDAEIKALLDHIQKDINYRNGK